MHRKSLTAVLAGALSLLALSASAAEPAAYDLYTVQRERTGVAIDIAGTVIARKTAQLSAQLPGRVSLIAGQEGDRFATGTVLVALDDRAWQAKLDAAVASRDAALASIRNANAQWSRELASPQGSAGSQAPGGMGMPAMVDQMFTNPMQSFMGMRNRGAERGSDLVARETQIAQANNAYRQAEAQIREIQAILRDTKSVAPFDGVIETVHVEVGDTVQPGQPLISYSETAGFQVQADVPVRLRPGLQEGMALNVQLDGSPPTIAAPISRIFPVADPEQHTVRIELDLPTDTVATVGQYAEISVPAPGGAQSASLLLPKSAIIRKGGLPLVFIAGPEGRARLRVIRVGEAVDANLTAVLSGIREGDRVVDNPPPGLRAGDPVISEPSASNNQ
jgi:RND family efflux transporter MFP subunit